MDKTLLKFMALGLVIFNLAVWGYLEYAPRWDVKRICEAYTEFANDKKLGDEGMAAVEKLTRKLDSMWTREGKKAASIISQSEPVFRRQLIEQAGFNAGIRFWSCPGVGM